MFHQVLLTLSEWIPEETWKQQGWGPLVEEEKMMRGENVGKND